MLVSCRETSELVPVTKALVCGVVRWPQRAEAVSEGSRLGIAEPVWVTTVLPTAEEVALFTCVAALVLTPDCEALPALPVALGGPPCTLVETPRAKPPALARRMPASAICGP